MLVILVNLLFILLKPFLNSRFIRHWSQWRSRQRCCEHSKTDCNGGHSYGAGNIHWWRRKHLIGGESPRGFFEGDGPCRRTGGFFFCATEFPFRIQSRTMAGQFSADIWTSIFAGLIFAFPYVIYQLWSFISPGLHKNERKYSRGFIFITSILFYY